MFLTFFSVFISCRAQNKSSDIEIISLDGIWVSGVPDLNLQTLEQGVQWQLAGLGRLPHAWSLSVEPVGEGQWWVELELDRTEWSDCVAELASAIPSEWPFAAQLAQLSQNPHHVALMTEQPVELGDWERSFHLTTETLLQESLIADSDRVISFVEQAGDLSTIAYKAHTLEMPSLVETIDVMPNGRLRYGQYENSQWVPHTELGSVAACMWCHEAKLLDIQSQVDVEGYASYAQFSTAVAQDNHLIVAQHDAQYPTGRLLELSNHASGEKIIEHYLFPNLDSLAFEMNLDSEAVNAWLASNGIMGTQHPEYPDWGTVYSRTAVNSALGQAMPIPMTPRHWDSAEWPSLISLEDCLDGAD